MQHVAPTDVMRDAKPVLNWKATRATYIGLDPSLTSTGVAVLRAGLIKTFVMPVPKKMRGIERLAWFRKELTALIEVYAPAAMAIEGYSFGSRDSHAHALGELGGTLRLAAYDCRLRFVDVPPSSVKKFVTGKGQCPKSVMVKEVYRRWGVDVNDDNEADAAALAVIAQSLFTENAPLTVFQTEALAKIAR